MDRPSIARHCPLCGAPAQPWHAFPRFREGWTISIHHDPECALFDAMGRMECRETPAAAILWWNGLTADDITNIIKK